MATPNRIMEIKAFLEKESLLKVLKTVLGFLIGKKNIRFQLNIGGGSYTDSKSLVIGLPDIFYNKPFSEIYVILIALLGHESQHILSSSMKNLLDYINEMTEYLKSKGINEVYARNIVHGVGNSLEDGRIEMILCNKFPGFIKKIQFLNMSIWEIYEIEGESKISDLMRTIITLSVLGIYPKGFKKVYADTDMDKLVTEIKPLIKQGVKAVTCKECLEFAKEIIYKIEPLLIEEFINAKNQNQNLTNFLEEIAKSSNFQNSKEEEKNNKKTYSSHLIADEGQNSEKDNDTEKDSDTENNEAEMDIDGCNDNNSNKNVDGNKNNNEGIEEKNKNNNKENADKDDDKKDKAKDGNKKDKNKTNNNSEEKISKNNNAENFELSKGMESSKSNAANLTEEEIEEKFNEIIKETKEEANAELEAIQRREMKELEKKEKYLPATTLEINELKASRPRFEFKEYDCKFNLDNDLPKELVVQGRKFRREVEKIFKNKAMVNVHGQEKGTLNTEDLWRISVKDYNVFSIEGAKSRSDYAIFILQDGSGSMRDKGKEIESAYALSIIEEGLRDIIPFKIVTFSAGWDSVEHFLVRGFKEKTKRNCSYNFLKYRRADGGNDDDVSIRIATNELLRRPERDKVLIVLSDGLPHSIERTKESIKFARDNKIHLVGIMFGTEWFRINNYENYKFMYEKNIISTSPNNIAPKLISTLKKILVR